MSWTTSFLSFARDERVLLASLGIVTFGMISSIYGVLNLVRDDNAIPPPQPKTQYITQDTEDSLQLDTLEKLLDHPNFSIREISIKILCDRAVNDPAIIEGLLFEITKRSYDDRMRGLRTLALLTGQTLGMQFVHNAWLKRADWLGLDNLEKLHNQKAYSALVRCLELCLYDNPPPDLTDSHWDEYYLRDMAERFCFMFLVELTNKYGPALLIRAKFVEKWLARQNWGNGPEERLRSFKDYMDFRSNRIVDVVSKVKLSKRGLKALVKVGLIDRAERNKESVEIIMGAEEAIQNGPFAEQQVPRTREHSAEEQRLRRQHREAMVLNDGTRPLGRDDIIERDHGSPA